MTDLKGQWALVLGASSGMGRAVAVELAGRGVHIVGVHFDTASAQPDVDALVRELRDLGVRVEFHNVNAASKAGRAAVLDELTELVSSMGIRVFVHSLAFGALAPYLDRGGDGTDTIQARQMDMTLNVMAHSLVYWTQDLHAARLLHPGAKVFAMTSAGTARVSPTYGAVSAAKCALEAHVRQLAVELAPSGVAVNALRAGVTITPSLRRIPEHESIVRHATETNPHGRLTVPQDVAEVVAVLSATDSSWLTGNVIGVDGGEVLTT